MNKDNKTWKDALDDDTTPVTSPTKSGGTPVNITYNETKRTVIPRQAVQKKSEKVLTNNKLQFADENGKIKTFKTSKIKNVTPVKSK